MSHSSPPGLKVYEMCSAEKLMRVGLGLGRHLLHSF